MRSSSLTEFQGLSCPVQTGLQQKETKATKPEKRALSGAQTPKCPYAISTTTHSTATGITRITPAIAAAKFGKVLLRIPVSRIPVSGHLFERWTTTRARVTNDAEAMGNDLDPVLCTVGPATAHRPHAIQLLGRLFPTDLPSPAGPTFRLSATELLPFRE